MKLLKLTLAALTITTTAYAFGEDVVSQQIRLTQTSIKLAQEQAQAGLLNQSLHSLDGDQKQAQFNALIPQTLALFESDVRMKVLTPLQAVINQYNSIVQSTQYDSDAKVAILGSLFGQIANTAVSRRLTYFKAAGALEAPLSSSTPFGVIDPVNHFGGESDVWRVNRETLFPTGLSAKGDETGSNQYVSMATASVAKGCFSKTCFYSSLNFALLWSTLSESILAQKISLKLLDGKMVQVDISSSDGYFKLVGSRIYAKVTGSTLIDSLPNDISATRFQAMQQIETSYGAQPFDARRCAGQVREIKKQLCRSSEGCMNSAEEAWLNFKASNFYIGDSRSACIVGAR